MSDDTQWAAQYGPDSGNDPGGRSGPPVWVVVVVVVSVVVGGWLLATQAFSGGDSVAGQTTIPFEPFATTTTIAPVATTTTVPVVTTLTVAPVDVSGFENPAAAIVVGSPSAKQLAGYVAVASPDEPGFEQETVWVFRPGGSVVSRSDAVFARENAEYPMLITAGRLIVDGWIYDIDLAEPPVSLWTGGSVYPGSGPGVIWLAQHDEFDPVDWVAQVDVESLTVGEQVDLTDIAISPAVGVADGLIVGDFNDESYAFWSPTDGLVGVDLPDQPGSVIAASGNLVVVKSRGVSVLDIRRRGFVSSFELPAGAISAASACLSPDGQHVIIVGSNGEAVVGDIATGEMIDIGFEGLDVWTEHGVGWTTNEQLVFIGEAEAEDEKHVFGYDITTGEWFGVAQLVGPDDWWLAASGTMC